MRFTLCVSAVLAASIALPALAADKPKAKPVPQAEAGIDYSSVCHPGATKGEVLCETGESFAYCQSLVGKGSMLVEGDDPAKPTAVVSCQQAG